MAVTLPTFSTVDEIVQRLKRKDTPRVEVVGPWGSGKSILALQVAATLKTPLLFITSGRLEAEGIHDDLCTFAGEDQAALFPAWEVLPTDTMSPADDIVAERMNTLKRLSKALDDGQPLFAVAPLRSLLQYVVNRKRLNEDSLTLKTGEEHDLDNLLARFIAMGYTREAMVEHRGDISVRGGIVDVFPISSELPYRVEFFGDEIDSIRRFEPETQRSVSRETELQILPRSEKALLSAKNSPEQFTALTDYFPKDTIVVVDEPLRLGEMAEELGNQLEGSPHHLPWEGALEKLGKFKQIHLAQIGYERDPDTPRYLAPMQSITGWAGQSGDFWEQLKAWDVQQFTVQLICVNTGERKRLLELLEEQGYRPGEDAFDLRVSIGRLQSGFTSNAEKLAVLSEREMFGRHYMRRKRRRFEAGQTITQFSDLKVGDYIVHADNGIGRYTGLRRIEGKAGDYMCIQYAGTDVMYVPVSQIDSIQKYSGGDGAMPKVDRLGGKTWSKKKAAVKKAVKDMTEELVKLYAAREGHTGYAFSADTPWQREFEDAFEYDETPDQARAIDDIKRDMESARPMDRLLCGDVGYGKTEVALRAAFKAVMDGKQVAILAPTTVLTQQHYQTCKERMADFPVRIELLNRFRTDKQQKETVDRVKAGEVDILIGTHRITSKDVKFKDLGLVIIDEEQRFGVGVKEKLKHLRNHVDVLTLSATPIPRTLHFSLIGVRDMSLINTAPNDRLPIHTAIEPWDSRVIEEAIERELAREGQVFFLHNRVQTIDKTAAAINKLVPRARVGIGHGQMAKHELEEIMSDFIAKKIDVLVCTTIIGSGIDIANANTIIVDRADTFGLGELYQIRGRVGRYKHRAFAYLLVPGHKALSEEAQLRLKALEDFSSLGSGFRIAMRDLEIRGCGNILGGEQSGNIATVGYETYKDLIAEAVAEHQGQPLRKRSLPPFDLQIDTFIPDEYVPTAQQKMTLYRRIAGVTSPEEIDELQAELKDRFGQPPAPVRRLLDVMRVRAFAGEAGAKSVVAAKTLIDIQFEGARFPDKQTQNRIYQTYGNAVEFAWRANPSITLKVDPEKDDLCAAAIELLKQIAED
ncbi:MAG: transcription-repair coupling factor [Candidatus Hydrogenedentes bacterium]|nr:transcription-repair coupling factor [Candidatus Hydrogenedentota bacterium]